MKDAHHARFFGSRATRGAKRARVRAKKGSHTFRPRVRSSCVRRRLGIVRDP